MNSSHFTFRKIEHSDRSWIESFIIDHWGSNCVVVHNSTYYPSRLDGFVAFQDKERVGLITYQLQDLKCEIVTLNSLIENSGIGSRLVSLVEKEAMKKKCKKVWLITTNDNLRAIGFYQKIGFQLVNVFPNAVEKARKIKPEIPLLSANGIPIRDELEFCLIFVT